MTRIILYSMLIISYYTSLFLDSRELTYFSGILAVIALCYSFPKAQKIYKVMGIFFSLTGLFLYIGQGKSILKLPEFTTSTVTLLSVMFVLPFISSAVIVGRYDRNVNKLLKEKAANLGQLYTRTSVVSFLLGSFLNIATLPLVQSVAAKNLRDKSKDLKDKFISQSLLRGYAFSLSCSPIELLIVLSVDITSTSYISILPLLLLFVGVMFGINLLFARNYQTFELDTAAETNQSPLTKRVVSKIVALIVYLILFISVIVTVNHFADLGFLEIVTIVIVPYSFLWALSIRRIKSFLLYSVPRWKANTISLSNFMALFLSVGFFLSVINDSFLIEYIHYPFEVLTSSPFLLFVFIQILFLGLAMVGFHPLVTISILGGVLTPFLGTINPISIALVLITSGLSTVMAGPFNISVSLTGSLLARNPYRISYWNLLFAFIFSSAGTLLATIVQVIRL
ncbi:hypothetical protein [Sediminibacillus massiliensis]|uniref:hypothetical protein n=1 Tax=Sediminibacillus massiliensis TaxID=1926277 RepID=UPI0009883597|nr:hypothetical protein [Sediminibacillus massiliensis]